MEQPLAAFERQVTHETGSKIWTAKCAVCGKAVTGKKSLFHTEKGVLHRLRLLFNFCRVCGKWVCENCYLIHDTNGSMGICTACAKKKGITGKTAAEVTDELKNSEKCFVEAKRYFNLRGFFMKRIFVLIIVLLAVGFAAQAQSGTWTQYLAANFGLPGLTAPQNTEAGFETGDPCRVWFRSDDGNITEAVFTAFAQQVWNQSGRVSRDGNYEAGFDTITYEIIMGKRFAQITEARTYDDEFEWCYTYNGKIVSIKIQQGSNRELRLNLERLS